MGVVLMVTTTDNQLKFALRLWESLAIDGKWVLPNVGVYVRTGERALALREMHTGAVLSEDANLFDHHDYIAHLASQVGWVVHEDIRIAYDAQGVERNIPADWIGKVDVCSNKCGAVIRVEPASPWEIYHEIKDGTCPVCKECGFDREWNNIHVVVDDRAVRLKQIHDDTKEEE